MDALGMLTALAGIVVLTSVVWHVRTWPVLGWLLVLGGAVLNTDASPKPIFSLGGTNVFAEDAILGVLILVAATQGRRLSSAFGQALVLPVTAAVLLVLNLALGYGIFGTPAIVEFRPFFYFLAAIMWAGSLDWTSAKTVRHLRVFLYACGWGLSCIALLNFAKNGIASSSAMYIDSEGTYRTLRPLVASQAALLGVAGLYALHDWGTRHSPLRLASGLTFITIVILAQHRSVWIALVVGLMFLAVTSGAIIARRLFAVSLIGMSIILVLLLTGLLDGVVQSLAASVDAITGTKSTLDDRESGWESLVLDSFDKGPWGILFGQPFGTGYERIGPTGQVQTYAPHNWFVSIYLRAGLLGFASFFILCAFSCLKLSRIRSVMAPLLLFIVVFALAYSIQWFLAVLIGVSFAIASRISGDQRDFGSLPLHRDTRPGEFYSSLRH